MTVRTSHILAILLALVSISCKSEKDGTSTWIPYVAEETLIVDIPDVHGTGERIEYSQSIVLNIPPSTLDQEFIVHSASVNEIYFELLRDSGDGHFEYEFINSETGGIWKSGSVNFNESENHHRVDISLDASELEYVSNNLISNNQITLLFNGVTQDAPMSFTLNGSIYGELLLE